MKLIMMDMDGTLFNDHKEISEGNRLALQEAKSKGMVVGIATGRARFIMKNVLPKYQLDGIVDFVVGYNGVEIWDCREDVVEYTHRLTPDLVSDIYHKIEGKPWNMAAYDETGRYVKVLNERSIHYASGNGQGVVEYDFEKGTRSWSKVTILPLEIRDYTKEELTELYSFNNDQYHGFVTGPFFFEYVHRKVSKVEGIKRVCEKLGITMEDVIAFGDSGNDLEMIEKSGIGVAVRNGTDEVKEVADYVTLSNNEDGIAYFLKKYIEGEIVL